jgi:hypothetical protein
MANPPFLYLLIRVDKGHPTDEVPFFVLGSLKTNVENFPYPLHHGFSSPHEDGLVKTPKSLGNLKKWLTSRTTMAPVITDSKIGKEAVYKIRSRRRKL